ncbi:MAG: hypothetical protein KGS72_20810 [Cyanobacteria bacterium REEB67]|nr:hypothetical protein [Cyanobacteria bacterium REEB67]
MTEMELIDQGSAAVVICTSQFEAENRRFELRFMRVWARGEDGWKIVAGSMIG